DVSIDAKPMGKTLGEGGLASTKVAGEKDDVAGAKQAGYSHSKLLCGRQVGQVQGLSHGYTHCLWTRGTRDPMRVTSSYLMVPAACDQESAEIPEAEPNYSTCETIVADDSYSTVVCNFTSN